MTYVDKDKYKNNTKANANTKTGIHTPLATDLQARMVRR